MSRPSDVTAEIGHNTQPAPLVSRVQALPDLQTPGEAAQSISGSDIAGDDRRYPNH
jgi:hypothetical protein